MTMRISSRGREKFRGRILQNNISRRPCLSVRLSRGGSLLKSEVLFFNNKTRRRRRIYNITSGVFGVAVEGGCRISPARSQ